MAVIESKGNGYSLFNGVILPHLPDYDKTKYSYAFIYGQPDDYTLVVSTEQYEIVDGESGTTEAGGTYVLFTLSAPEGSEYKGFKFNGGTAWEASTADYAEIVSVRMAWSNADFSQFSGSHFFPLDGMNVIMWDGDSTDLEASPQNANYYLVSNATNIDTAKDVAIAILNPRNGSVFSTTTPLTDKGGYYTALGVQYASAESETFPAKGVFFQTAAARRVTTLAYHPPIEYGHLTFSSDEAFSIGAYSADKNWDGTLYYSTDAVNWIEWDGSFVIDSGEHKGEHRIYMRGKGNTVIGGGARGKRWIFAALSIRCEGNIENLLDYEVVAAGNHPPMGEYCFGYLFYDWPLISAPELPATTLSKGCYRDMFANTTLSAPVELPATTLVDICYRAMFNNCANIKISEEQSDEYWKPYRIPSGGEGNMVDNATQVMFSNTGGTFVGAPEINKTYYLAIPRSGGASIGRKFLLHKIFGNLAIEKVLNK